MARWRQARRPIPSVAAAWGRGGLWLGLSTAAHFGLGLALFGQTLPGLLAKYDLSAGGLWGLVSLAILVARRGGRGLVGTRRGAR